MAYTTQLRRPLQPGEVSPIINKSLRYRSSHLASRFQYVWGMFDIAMFLLLLWEVRTQYLQLQLIGENDVLHYFMIGVCVSFAFSALINFVQAVQSTWAGPSPLLSPKQKQLLGYKQSEMDIGEANSSATPQKSTVIRQPFNLSALISSTPTKHRTLPLSNSPHVSPLSSQMQNQSTNASPNLSHNSTPGFNLSQNARVQPRQRTLSPPNQGSPVIQGLGVALDGSSYLDSSGGGSGSPFLRHRMSPFRTTTPLSPDEFMVDQNMLTTYLRSHFEKEQTRAQMLSLDSSFGSSPGKWGYSRGVGPMDISQELLKNIYQTATASPKSPTSRKDDKDDATKYAALEYWRKHGISSEVLTEWTARMRRWIAVTLLSQLVNEASRINASLKKLGCPEVQIGESSLSSLKQIIASKGNQIPNLTRLLPYLEVTNNQEYLLARLKTLASGGYMSEFKWNAGAEVKGRKWADDLPTDCDLVMHVFCVYMDSHLPADPRYPDGKTFTSKYFVRTPDKPKPVKDDRIVIHHNKINPPHFRLISKETDYNVPIGRNNMFHAVLLFLHHIKVKMNGMLGQVNLGASGINILWILDTT